MAVNTKSVLSQNMNTSLHGKLKVVSLPSSFGTPVSNCASIMRLSLLSLLKQNQLYHFKVAIHFPASLRRTADVVRLFASSIKTKRLIKKLIIVIQLTDLWIASYYYSSRHDSKTGRSISWRELSKGTSETLLHRPARMPHRHFRYSSFVLDRSESISVSVLGFQFFQTSPLLPSTGKK